MTANILATELSPSSKAIFRETFYGLWGAAGFGKFDFDSPLPWGNPWLHGSPITLTGSTVTEMARNYFEDCRVDIADILAAEREAE